MIVWSAAEIAVTMICIGIPVCRPLYKQYLDKWTSRDASKNYQQQRSGGRSYPLRTFGGSTMPGDVDERDADVKDQAASSDHSLTGGDSVTTADRKLGLNGPFTKSYAMGGERVTGDNQSDEEILGPDFRRSQRQEASIDVQRKGTSGGGIQVTDEFEITTSRARN